MPKSMFEQILNSAAGKANLSGFFVKLLLGWYLHEIEHVKIAQDPGDAIVTYPLA